MSEYVKLTLVENDKPLFVRSQYISGAFENNHLERIETVLNMSSGACYKVKERVQDIMAFLDSQNETKETTETKLNGELTEISMFLNKEIDMERIVDSMQLDSGQTIASMRIGNIEASLEVQGDVLVKWCDDPDNPENGKWYRRPSEFPEELKNLIEEWDTDHGMWTDDPRVVIEMNNWFELFVGEDGTSPDSNLVNASNKTPGEIFSLLYEAIKEYSE